MVVRTAWKDNELVWLRNGMAYRTPIKVLARGLGRTPCAVQKAMLRLRESIEEQKENADDNDVANWEERSVKVSFDDVLAFLEQNGYIFRKKQVRLGPQRSFIQFFLDNLPVSLARILVRANTIRLEMKKPIFEIFARPVQIGPAVKPEPIVIKTEQEQPAMEMKQEQTVTEEEVSKRKRARKAAFYWLKFETFMPN
jgi:hypothetical protein